MKFKCPDTGTVRKLDEVVYGETEAMQAHVCDSATEALTLLSYCKYFYFLLDSSVQDVKTLDSLH